MNLASMCASPLVGSSELIAGGGTGSGVASEEDQIVSINRNSGSVVRSVSICYLFLIDFVEEGVGG